MRKYYLPLICVGLSSVALYSQDTYVTGNVTVKVQPNTLFYNGSDFIVTENVTESSVIMNEGNIKINGNFDNSSVSASEDGGDGANFVSRWTDQNEYGQVIIADDATSAGMLTMEKKAINPTTFTWGQFAIPYVFTNAKTALETLFPGIVYKSGTRYNHSIMTWDNAVRPEYDHKAPTTGISPTDYVLLNLTSHTELIGYMEGGDPILPYAGTPANGEFNAVYKPSIYPTTVWNTWKNQKNTHNEKYSTYIEEHIRVSNSTDFGRFYFQFGNPYTSNIDLSYIGTNTVDDGVYVANLLGVVKISGAGWNQNVGIESSVAVRATWDGAQWGGNPDALIIKPFEGFYVGLKADATLDSRTFHFNDGLKTFSMTPAATVGTDPGDVMNGKNAPEESGEPQAEDRMSASLSLSTSASRTSFYQLGLNLFTEDGVATGNAVYVIVDSKSQTGIAQPLESDYADFNRGFFLTQENADGSEVTTPNRIMQINTVHPKYVAKPIQLFFKKDAQDVNGYILKADLFYKNIFRKLGEHTNYADGNSFFFYDKAQDVLMPITSDFSYYIERPEQTQNSRYVIYWNGGPARNSGKMGAEDEAAAAGLTQVYKDGDLHKVRFDQSWQSADISVYDLTGRLIHKVNNVKTDVDYVLDLPNTATYVVKIQSGTGEVVTQKILK